MANTKIPSELIADSSITAAKLADGTITTADIADSNVTTAKIADSNVTTAKIGDAQVTTAKITDANVTTGKIADDAVTTAKMASNSVTSDTIASGITLAGTTTFGGDITMASTAQINASNAFYLDSDIIHFRANNETERMRIQSSGVGIGTTSPTAVANYKVLQLRGGSTSNGGLIRLETSDGTSGVARFYAGSGSTVLESTSNTPLTFGTNGTTAVTIDTSQNVGIGTTAPTTKLEVSSGGADVTTIKASYNSTNYLEFAHNRINAVSSGGNDSILLQTAGTTRAIINQSGNVGINQTNPSHKLQVAVDANGAFIKRDVASNAANLSEFNSNRSLLLLNRNAGSYLAFGGNSSRTDIQATDLASTPTAKIINLNPFGGNVGIGTTSPVTSLQINPSSGGYNLFFDRGNSTPGGANPWLGLFNATTVSASTYGWGFYDSNSDGSLQIWNRNNSTTGAAALTIIRGGNVGLGTSSPAEKLQVKGAVGFEAGNSTNRWSAYTYTDNTFRLNYNGAGADELTIDSSGNVGIGNTNPNKPLTITADSGANGMALRARSADDYSFIQFFNNAGTALRGQIYSKAAGDIGFTTGTDSSAGNDLYIKNGTGVGIGTASPDYKLDVTGPTGTYANGDLPIAVFQSSTDHRAIVKVQNNNENDGASAPRAAFDLDVKDEASGNRIRSILALTKRTDGNAFGNTDLTVPYDFNIYVNNKGTITTSSGAQASSSITAGDLALSINAGKNATFAGDVTTAYTIQGGAYKIGGTVVINSSRNLTNIGTISSGRINPQEHIIFGSNTGYLQFPAANSTAWAIYPGSGTNAPGTQGTGLSFHHWNGSAWNDEVSFDTGGGITLDGRLNNAYGNGNIAAPSTSDHSAGTRQVYYDSSATAWYARGIEGNTLWDNVDQDWKLYRQGSVRLHWNEANDSFNINDVREYRKAIYLVNNVAYTFDIDVKSIGASGQVMEVFAGYTHYSTTYAAVIKQIWSQRSTAQSDVVIINNTVSHSTSQAGAWSFTYVDANTVRLTKSAGTYGGAGHGYIALRGTVV